MNTYTIGIVDGCDCSSTTTVDLSKYDKHIQDTTVHITQKERDAWNSASAAISGVNIISALSNKADREDVPTKVSQLQNDMGYLNEVPEEYLTELELNNKGFIRTSDLDGLLEGKIPALSGYATTSWVLQQGFLTEHQHIKQISDGTNTYSLIGDGVVTIKGNTSSDPGTQMVTATTNSIGGIKLGYTQNGKNYAVKLDNEDRAYVSVPWVSGESSSSTGNSSGYYEIIFKAVEKGVTPSRPTNFDSNAEDWEHYAVNSDGTKVVWMTQRFVNADGTKDPWQAPWIISGADGEMGVDGAYYEYIYTRTNSEDATTVPQVNSNVASSTSIGKTASDDDFVPQNWTDNPQGVSQSMQYEWMALRQKTFNRSNVGTWSDFIGPILWSKYGVNGNDGDGVEYIYYATTAYNTVAPSGPTLNPSNWYTKEQSKADVNETSYNRREYISPDASNYWFDNPINLTTPGQIEYVSIRKKYADEEGEAAYWHQYSQPAFWTSYAKNGADATGLTLSYTDDNITVDITEEGHPSTPISTTTVLTGNYGNEDVKFTSLPTITAMHTDGSTTGFTFSSTTSSSVVKYTDGSANEIDILTCTLSQDQKSIDCYVNITQNFAIDLKSPIIFTLSVNGISASTSKVVSGSKSFRITGIQFGKDGVSYNLVCGVASISKKYNAATSSYIYATQSITPKIIETSVNGVADVTNQSGFVIKYSIDDGEEQSLSDAPIVLDVIKNIKQFIIINAYYNDSLFDGQTIYLVEDGAPGAGGNSPTYYQVVVTSSTLENTYQGDVLKLNGTVTFQVYSLKDGVVTNITDQNTLSITPQPVNISTVNKTFAAQYTNADATNSVQIKYPSSGNIFASASVPIPTRGKDGSSSSGTQTLTKSSLRYKGEFSTTDIYRDGVTTSESNVYYQDYVTYKNVYYLCVKDVSGSLESPNPYSPNTDDTHWKPLSATNDMFVNLLVANKANIGSLSSNEIVVYDTAPGGANRTIQAGITAGYKFDDSPIKDVNNNGVRIWAGSFTNGNLATAPFTVDSTGHLKATDAQISGEIDAVSGTIGGWDITQNSIQKIYGDADSNKSANIYLQNSTNKIVQIGGIFNSMMSVRNDGNVGIDISSFGIGGIGLHVLGNANAYGIISFGHTNFISRQGERTYINQLALQNLVLTDDSVIASNVGPKISSPTPIDQQVVPYRIFAIENKDQTINLGNEFCGDKQIEIILGSRNDGSACTKTISATWLSRITWIGAHLRAVKMPGTTIQFSVGHINDNNIAMYKITIIKSTEYIAIVNRL